MHGKNGDPLITVAVPIYNVENYLSECIDSIIAQSYKNLEIILVDDGSPDKCGELCDEYQKADMRIRVIHQKNKGLSGARNSAIDIAEGEYITFVDSDDWISQDMVEKLYQKMVEMHADMVVSGIESFYEDGTKKSNNHEKEVLNYTREEALDCFLFNDYLTPCVCGKLYKTSLWDDVRHPEGKLFEDQFTTYKIIDRCDKIVYLTTPMYHYRKRSGSIGHSTFGKKTYHLYEAIHEEYEFIVSKYSSACPNIAVARITWEIVFVDMLILANYQDMDAVRDTQRFARKHMKEVWRCGFVSGMRKGQIFLFAFSYPLYTVFYLQYKRKHLLS